MMYLAGIHNQGLQYGAIWLFIYAAACIAVCFIWKKLASRNFVLASGLVSFGVGLGVWFVKLW